MPAAQELVVYPAEPQAPDSGHRLSTPVGFGGLFDLEEVSYAEGEGSSEITLWWHVLADVGADYTIFVHSIDSNGKLIAQDDAMPDAGRSPTRLWQAGDRIRDGHSLAASLPADGVFLIGAYDPSTMTRLPAIQNQQPLADNALQLRLVDVPSLGD
jgi:hypothetical protein